MAESTSYDCKNGIFFKRLNDDSIRIRKHASLEETSSVDMEIVIDAGMWNKIVSHVEKKRGI